MELDGLHQTASFSRKRTKNPTRTHENQPNEMRVNQAMSLLSISKRQKSNDVLVRQRMPPRQKTCQTCSL
jgi:hypothetical protein